jgi:hypothetical protein
VGSDHLLDPRPQFRLAGAGIIQVRGALGGIRLSRAAKKRASAGDMSLMGGLRSGVVTLFGGNCARNPSRIFCNCFDGIEVRIPDANKQCDQPKEQAPLLQPRPLDAVLWLPEHHRRDGRRGTV